MGNAIKTGQRFTWSAVDGNTSGEAVVKDVKSDRDEGLSPETEAYVSLWIDATGLSGARRDQAFQILLGADGKSYLDGKKISVEV